MKTSIKMIIALALALAMICGLGTVAFADSNTIVTKNPTDERHYAGETATFIADAVNYDGIEWFFIAPNGTEYKLDAFKTQFPACTVKGQGTTTLQITNLQTGLDGWKVFCCFTLGSNCSATTAARISILIPSAPVTTAPANTTTYYTTYVPSTVYYEPDYASPTTSSLTAFATTPTARLSLTRITLPTTSCLTAPASTPSATTPRIMRPTTSCLTVPASTT